MSISYSEALSRIDSLASQLRPLLFSSPILLPLDSALGSTSAQEITSNKTLPPLDNSAMDGFAVSSGETLNASIDNPVTLEVIGSIAAGDHPPFYDDQSTPFGSCFHINTGAPFPLPSTSSSSASSNSDSNTQKDRFDACLRKEDASLSSDGKQCTLIKPVKPRQHRRQAGEDFKPGIKLLSTGDIISAEIIAALSYHGIAHVNTVRQPRIAVLSTGKELEQLEEDSNIHNGTLRNHGHFENGVGDIKKAPPPSHIYDSNSHYILGALKEWGYTDVTRLESLGDNPDEYKRTVERCTEQEDPFDILISTGGVSKGQHDYIESTLLQIGAQIQYHGIQMRPGHPALLATYSPPSSPPNTSHLNRKPSLTIFGLPGNPCAAAATLRFLVRPFLRLAMGREIEEPSSKARLVVGSSSNKAHHLTNGKRDKEVKSSTVSISTATPSAVPHSCGADSTSSSGQHRRYFLAQYEGYTEDGVRSVKTLNKGSGMVRPLSIAHCWILLKEDQIEEDGVLVDCYDLNAGRR